MLLSTSFIRFAGAGEASASRGKAKRKRDNRKPSSSGETAVAEPAHKRVAGPEISLSGIRMQIRKLPEVLRPLCIPRTALAQDIFELSNAAGASSKDNPNFLRKLWISKIDLLTLHGIQHGEKNDENDRILLQSLIKGQQTVFERLLNKNDHPELGPLLEAAALQNNQGALQQLFRKATRIRYDAPLSTLEFVAGCGQLELLRQLFSISTLSADRKKALWKNAIQQKKSIERLRQKSQRVRQTRFENLTISPPWPGQTELQRTQEILAQIRSGTQWQAAHWPNSPLCLALLAEHAGIGKVLIYAGNDVNLNLLPNLYMAPIHAAVFSSLGFELVKLLIDAGADINKKTSGGKTPLHDAAHRSGPDLIRLLLKSGANVHEKTDAGVTPLHYAALKNYPEAGKLFLDAGANFNEKTNEGHTPLHYLSVRGVESQYNELNIFRPVDEKAGLNFAKMLIEKGAEVNARANNGDTPLTCAIRGGNPAIADLLRRHGGEA